MRSFLCFVTFSALVLAVSASPVSVERRDNFRSLNQCTPGQAFFMSCNLCICSFDGTYAACTFMHCWDWSYEGIQRSNKGTKEIATRLGFNLPRVSGYTQGDRCPARIFYNDCNVCICGPNNASAACTTMMCLTYEIQRLPKKGSTELTEIEHIDNYMHGEPCPANKLFYNLCNMCLCSPKGFSAACTAMFCPPEN